MVLVSPNDLARIGQLRSRQLTLPLLLVQDSLLPGQTMELASADGQFNAMLDQSLLSSNSDDNDNTTPQLCIVGMHPSNPGEPLSMGVSATIESVQRSGRQSLLLVKGLAIVDVQGSPRFRDNCFVADLEIAQDDADFVLSRRHLQKAADWYDELLPLVREWQGAMKDSHDVDIDTVITTTSLTGRAHAVAALLNPSCKSYDAMSMDIRPALLACRNEYDRLHLVHIALQASLQQLQE